MKRKLLAMLVCVALVGTLFPFAAMAEETQVRYVAIGDSISSGYGLEAPETEAFSSLIAQYNGYTLTNLAQAGETTVSLLAKLENAEMAEALSTADVITLTIGGNDMLAALFDYLAETTGGQMTAQEILMLFMGQGENADLTTLAPLLQSMTAFPQSAQATEALASFGENFASLLAKIKGLNPDATLVVATQYNPYSHLDGTALGGAVTGIISAFDAGVTALNLQIQTLAAATGCDVADVCNTFKAENTAANPLCNATLSPDVNMDIHPNAAGHAVIAAVMASALAGEPPAETALPFTDVADGDWFYDAVAYVYGHGIMTGTSDTAFSPNLTTTRGMIVSILNRLEDGPTAEVAGFTDVADGDWYADAVNWAASEGIVAGYEDNTFRPNDPITREQLAAMLMNYAAWKGEDVSVCADLSGYNDAASVSSWAAETVQWAVAEGLISGMPGNLLEPQGSATRAQVAAILERFLEQ